MNLRKLKEKALIFLKKKTVIVFIILALIIVLASALIILTNRSLAVKEKSWEIDLTYNSSTKKLSLDKLTLLNQQTITDQRGALYSPYKLEVLDKKGKVIFGEKINITEQILYDYFINAPDNSLSLPSGIKTVLFIPYQNGSSKIVISRNNNVVLKISLPQAVSFNFVSQANALTQSVSCGPITTVFINDNYTNITQFKNDVSYLENLYNSTPPYNITPSIFNFEEVDAAQNYGCAKSGITWCMENLTGSIKNVGLKYYPNAQKFIVLVDNPNAMAVDGGIAGLVNGVGGDVIIYTNYVYSGPTGGKPFAAASHELEGHAVGYLWDRYVSTDPSYSAIPAGYPKSNCSTNPSGESFWSGAGSTGVYKGCANSSQYAPFPLTCQSGTKNLISGGTNNTIMSAIGCAPNEFDSVEQAWIKSNILPYYQPCSGGPQTTNSPTPTPVPSSSPTFTPTPSPTPTPQPIVHSITGTAFVDNNNNGVQDPGEQGYQGLNISIQGPISATTTTDFSGKYAFINVPVGTYSLQAFDKRLTISFSLNNLSILQNTLTQTMNFPIPAYALNTPTPTPISTAFPTPTPTPFAVLSPTPTPQSYSSAATYTCVFDSSCITGQSSIQICPLKCTPNP